MSQYLCPTQKGRALIAKMAAEQKVLIISRVMFGAGVCPNEENPRLLEDLIEPMVEGTSGVPNYDGDTIHMMLEYRNDLNGGLEHGFSIKEFGVFIRDEAGEEVMVLYGSLGEPGQWVSAYDLKGKDVRRFPISIIVGEDAEVILDYVPQAFMTAEDVYEYCTITVMPQMLEKMDVQLEGKQDKVTGNPGQLAGFDKDGRMIAQDAPDTGVVSFNGRKGVVVPEAGDYTADQVGALDKSGTAAAAKKLSAARAIDGVSFDGTAAITHYGTCSTAAATAAKSVSLTGFSLVTGAKAAVKFTNANTAANPTLNVNGTGAKAIMKYGTTAAGSGAWAAGEVIEFIYDGTNFIMKNGATVPAHSHNYAGSSSDGGAAASAQKLSAAQAIDGVSFDGTAAITHYGTCSTAAATAAKAVSLTGFSLVTGAKAAVKFTKANTAANPTLNVNGTGAKAIMKYGTTAAGSGAWAAGEVIEFIYDGTNFVMEGANHFLDEAAQADTRSAENRTIALRRAYNSWQQLSALPEIPHQDGAFRQGFAQGENPYDPYAAGDPRYVVNGMAQLPDRLWTANWAAALTMNDVRPTFRTLSSISTEKGSDTCAFTFTAPYSGYIASVYLHGEYDGNTKDSQDRWANDGSCTVRVYNDETGALLQETPSTLNFYGYNGWGDFRIPLGFFLHGKIRHRIEVQMKKMNISIEYTPDPSEEAVGQALEIYGRKQSSVSFTRRLQAEGGARDGLVLVRYDTWGPAGSVSLNWLGKTLAPVKTRTVTFRGMEVKEAEFRPGTEVPEDSTLTLTLQCGTNGEFSLFDWGAVLI